MMTTTTIDRATDRQVAFVLKLCATRDLSGCGPVPSEQTFRDMSKKDISRVIDNLLKRPELPNAVVPATSKAIAFLASLAAERTVPDGLDVTVTGAHDVSVAINTLLNEPVRPDFHSDIEDGMYRIGENVYKVQMSRETGRPYAKLLNPHTQKFTYDAGAIRSIKPEHRMTLEEAKAYGIEFGVCCVCGRLLTNPESIEAGIGPICASRV